MGWEVEGGRMKVSGCGSVLFSLITMITVKLLAYDSMIQSQKWFLEFHDHLNCFCFLGFYYEISYCPFFKLSENSDLHFVTK